MLSGYTKALKGVGGWKRKKNVKTSTASLTLLCDAEKVTRYFFVDVGLFVHMWLVASTAHLGIFCHVRRAVQQLCTYDTESPKNSRNLVGCKSRITMVSSAIPETKLPPWQRCCNHAYVLERDILSMVIQICYWWTLSK